MLLSFFSFIYLLSLSLSLSPLRYEERIDRVESRIAARLRDQLGSARNANEMFRIFSRYNALFVRPHIRGAIREYQTQLIQRVKEDIENLHKKFKVYLINAHIILNSAHIQFTFFPLLQMQYKNTPTYAICCMRDVPPISSSIMWARQVGVASIIKRRVHNYGLKFCFYFFSWSTSWTCIFLE